MVKTRELVLTVFNYIILRNVCKILLKNILQQNINSLYILINKKPSPKRKGALVRLINKKWDAKMNKENLFFIRRFL